MKKVNSRLYLYIAALGGVLMLAIVLFYMLTPVSKSETTQYLYIDNDDTQDSVVVKLESFCHTAGKTGLTMLLRHSGYAGNIRSGRYAIDPGQGAFSVFRRLRNGQQAPLHLVIPEVRTMDRLAAFLGRKLMADSAAFAAVLNSQEACRQLGYDTCTIAAMFVPNTYDVYWNVSVEGLMQRMRQEHDRFWHGDREAKAAVMQLTSVEVCTLASIIDEETADNAEKPMVAGMYLNRLQRHMPLQADPTVKFALRQFDLRRIYHKHLQTDSPWNTYRYEGLPPGPIKIASIKGIDAVLNHVSHDYLYMCAKADFSGSHAFAATYQEHLVNAARYTRALNARGIK